MGKNEKVSAETAKKSGGLRFLTWLMLVVIAITSIIDVFCIYNVFGKGPVSIMNAKGLSQEQIQFRDALDKERKETAKLKSKGIPTYIAAGTSGTSDLIITGNDSVYEALEACSDDFGITNAREEYRIAGMTSGEFCDVYTAQQRFSRYDVFDRNIKVFSDKRGRLLGMTGTHYPMPDGYEAISNISGSDAQEAVIKHLKSTEKASTDDYGLRSSNTVIYINEDDEPELCYVYSVTDKATNTAAFDVLVNADDGGITTEITESAAQNLNFNKSDFNYHTEDYVCDLDNNIYVYGDYDERRGYKAAESKNAAANKMLKEATKAAKFFDENYDRSLESYYITVDKASDHQRRFLNSAADDFELTHRYGDRNNDGLPDQSSSALLEENIDPGIIFREYARAVMPYDIAENSVINAGLADIFAELIEDYSDGEFDGSCDWEIDSDNGSGTRNIKEPSASDNAASLSDAVITNKDYSRDDMLHDSTIISHSAYLMTQGVDGNDALTTEQLGYLYYHAMLSMPSNATYEQFRDVVTSTAMAMNRASYDKKSDIPKEVRLSDSQLACVISAFDTTGIKLSGTNRLFEKQFAGNCEFTVYDSNFASYEEYHVEVINTANNETVLDEDMDTSLFKLPDVENGIYNIKVSDLNNEAIGFEYNNVFIGNSEKEENSSTEKIATKFGTQSRDVALVLDVSGSMRGTPIDETKKSAVKFIDYVLSENPSVNISIIPYSSSATEAVVSSNDRSKLISAIQGFYANGGTNMHDGIKTAYDILKKGKSDKQLMFVMSDGYPENGPVGKDNTFESAIIEKADEVKSRGILVYSLGFFHNLTGEELTKAQNLMKSIASPGYSYNIKSSEDLGYAFNDLADNVGGNYSIIIRIACPVDVTVKCSGEYLSSAEDQLNTRASFGSLSFEGENDEIKVLRLNDDVNYELCINGTGDGEMDYTISFADEDGEYTDVRTFESVPITPDTIIATNTKASGKTTLNVDSDGDGKFDETYTAGRNGSGESKGSVLLIVICITLGILLLVFVVLEIIVYYKNSKYNRVCHKCGAAISGTPKFCNICGGQIVQKPLLLLPKSDKERPKQTPTVITAKLVAMSVCTLIMISVVMIYKSAATTVYKQLRSQELVSAEMMYNSSVEDTEVQKKYLSMLTKRYLNQVEDKYKSGDISEDQVKTIYDTVFQMDMGEASDIAEDRLKDLGVEPKRNKKKKKSSKKTTTTRKTTSKSYYVDEDDYDFYDDDDDYDYYNDDDDDDDYDYYYDDDLFKDPNDIYGF